MRRLTSTVLTLAVVPAAIALPVVSAPAPAPHPVAPRVASVALSGVDPVAAAEVPVAARTSASPEPAAGAGLARAGVDLGPAVLTARTDTSRFDLVGLTWEAGTAAEGMQVHVRVRTEGRWSAWEPLDAMDEGPDDGTEEAARAAGRDGTGALVAAGSDGLQVRVDTPTGRAPRGLRAELVDGGRSAADGVLPSAPAASASAAAGTPTVITRAQWGADESLRSGTPTYNSKVKALVLHHTAGSNSYSSAGAYAELRATYAYHTKVRGWSDIGYNILVDRYGRIYEGRKGSITEAVMGAHAGGFNTFTFGVSVMGNFDVASPPAAVVNALKLVMGWKAEEFGINPTGTTQLTSSGGGTSRYAAGVTVTKPTIMGHRDVGQTACPGRYLYPSLPALRSYAAAVVAPAVSGPTVSPAALEHAGGPVTFTARLSMGHSWVMTVTAACGGIVRTLSGSAARGTLTARWDLKDGSATWVPPGVYTVRMALTSRWGPVTTVSRDVEVLTSPSSPASACAVRRLSGQDRYATSVVVGRAAFPAATSAVIASGTAAADGVVAGPLAQAKSAPLLLSGPTSLPPVVAAEITRRGVSTVWVVGGTSVVPQSVLTQLQALGVTTVHRLAGATRYATAAAVAAEVGAAGQNAVVAAGADAHLIDAVVAGGAAGRLGRPILLVTATSVPTQTSAALQALGVTGVDILGDASVVGDVVSTALEGYGVTRRTRLGGADRFATAAAIASAYGAEVGTDDVAVAPGSAGTVIDALLAGQLGRVTLLTALTTTPASTASWLGGANPSTVVLVGGPGGVSTAGLKALSAAVA